ncbi:Retrovirus-related Pol polyprotein from transposon 297 [Biomphalaria pfeifferi]|uniref:Retrovirus-related Pol polyprotein from transposon 297 n=1 Tax=Biomphalaria pfeifferi TaxID=112525 RepID=A0AAD8CDA7_BIOPF|nr:Retrovirus-related Pol polyprotein from transposon 297 [Biomphalaria pfeifferi]
MKSFASCLTIIIALLHRKLWKDLNSTTEFKKTINEFITAIKAISEYCNFGPALQESLRDRFVCGLKDVNIQKRLLQEANLTLLTAINIATAMERPREMQNTFSLMKPNLYTGYKPKRAQQKLNYE